MNKLLTTWFVVLVSYVTGRNGADLRDVSESVFGQKKENVAFLPAAFGDFNSDKLTDFVVFHNDQKHVAILTASEQSVVEVGSNPIFRGKDKSLNCSCPQECKFVSAAPGDFNGDGSMDLMAVTRNKDDKMMMVNIMWGGRDRHGVKLECVKDLVTIRDIVAEPLVFDYNGDSIADLFTVDVSGNRTVYQFSKDKKYETIYLEAEKNDQLKAEHGNAFVDITSDGRADLVLTTVSGLEIHEGLEKGFKYKCLIPWPDLPSCDVNQCIGQPAYLDFYLSGNLQMVLPVCFDPKCQESKLYFVEASDLNKCPRSWDWKPMKLGLDEEGENWRFTPRNIENAPLHSLIPRIGDVNLDGWPDLLMTMYNKSGDSRRGQTQLLLNVPCGTMSGCGDNMEHVWRQFQVQPEYTRGIGDAITSAFFDLYEDGKMDLIVISKDDSDKFKVSAYVNTTQDSDAYFMKVIVLSGACYLNCDGHDSSYIPYGTNSGGQLVSYQSQRPGQETFDSYKSVAVQLPQTSHFSLGLPYTIFGLGMAPNFVDMLTVNISKMSHEWPQIIPNSQLYIIPYPNDVPSRWDLKLIITTSKNIVFTGLALVGTCALCSVIIVMLHIRQKRQDRQAKLQDAGRFHFDAM